MSVSSFYKAKFSKYSGSGRSPPPGRRHPQPSFNPSSSRDVNTSLNGHQAPWSTPVYYGDTHGILASHQPLHQTHQPSSTSHPLYTHHSTPPPSHHHPAPHTSRAPVRYSGPVYSHRRPSLYELFFKIYPTQLYLGWKRIMRSL